MVVYNLWLVRAIQKRIGSEYTILYGCLIDVCCMLLFIQPWLDDLTAWVNETFFIPCNMACNKHLYSYSYHAHDEHKTIVSGVLPVFNLGLPVYVLPIFIVGLESLGLVMRGNT